ncbi:AbrB/MazE/SpoVT family DNA-binding domain-containing protein [Aquifex aeolicus]|uniref:AbrB/MazE/SpoVT family DNA-binding domain-containing protein n=1 Tax=Aquifex aeolicus TaxID=63363 RepID=UPI000303508C|nr:AbrB/MazE/SpoVT family DNA-binding domain-containing protein [Aquifex aeolicus]
MVGKDEIVVKVLPKGQITLPKRIREKLGIREGDILIVEEKEGKLEIRKPKSLRDFYGFLKGKKSINRENIERVIEEVVKERELEKDSR